MPRAAETYRAARRNEARELARHGGSISALMARVPRNGGRRLVIRHHGAPLQTRDVIGWRAWGNADSRETKRRLAQMSKSSR